MSGRRQHYVSQSSCTDVCMHHRLRTSCVLLPSLNGITILIALKAPAPLRRLVPSVIFGRTYATVSTAASLQRSAGTRGAIGPGAPLATRRLIQMRNIYKWTVDTHASVTPSFLHLRARQAHVTAAPGVRSGAAQRPTQMHPRSIDISVSRCRVDVMRSPRHGGGRWPIHKQSHWQMDWITVPRRMRR